VFPDAVREVCPALGSVLPAAGSASGAGDAADGAAGTSFGSWSGELPLLRGPLGGEAASGWAGAGVPWDRSGWDPARSR
jgi:hypothetical protein